MKKTIRKFKLFTIVDYQKEENYLTEMSRNGYRLKKVSWPGIYTFEVVKPENYIYRLDFNDSNNKDFNHYLSIFKDNGWEYLFDFVGWAYFRKNGKEKNTEIFSTNESKIELIKKLFYYRLLPLLIIFTIIVLPKFIDILNGSILEKNNTTLNIINIIFICLYFLYVYLITYTGISLYKLLRKYSEK